MFFGGGHQQHPHLREKAKEKDKDNYYNLLDVPESATPEEIKKAYRKMSLKYHPDKNPGDAEASAKFCKINSAFEVLGDPDKKRNYDMGGTGNDEDVDLEDFLQKMFFGFGPGFGPGMNMNEYDEGQGFPGQGFPGMNPNIRIFTTGGFMPPGHGFGHTQFKQNMQKPSPIIKTLEISMEQVLSGATVPIEIERWMIENGLKVFEKENIYVTIPQGIDDNEIIIIRDKGNSLGEQSKGDIKIFIKVNNRECEFMRNGLDLIYEKTIGLKEALCGFSFEMRYLNGKVYTINNNRGNIIPYGFVKVIPNMGIARDGSRGALHIHFKVVFPESLSGEQIDQLLKIL